MFRLHSETQKASWNSSTLQKCRRFVRMHCNIVPTQVEKIRAELANLNHCAVPFLSRAAVNLCRYYYTSVNEHITTHFNLCCFGIYFIILGVENPKDTENSKRRHMVPKDLVKCSITVQKGMLDLVSSSPVFIFMPQIKFHYGLRTFCSFH